LHIILWQTDEVFEVSYTDTRQSETGDIKHWIDSNQWVGEWEEPKVDRGGELHYCILSDDGKKRTSESGRLKRRDQINI